MKNKAQKFILQISNDQKSILPKLAFRKRKKKLSQAAKFLYQDYKLDNELTAFSSLDSEDFIE